MNVFSGLFNDVRANVRRPGLICFGLRALTLSGSSQKVLRSSRTMRILGTSACLIVQGSKIQEGAKS